MISHFLNVICDAALSTSSGPYVATACCPCAQAGRRKLGMLAGSRSSTATRNADFACTAAWAAATAHAGGGTAASSAAGAGGAGGGAVGGVGPAALLRSRPSQAAGVDRSLASCPASCPDAMARAKSVRTALSIPTSPVRSGGKAASRRATVSTGNGRKDGGISAPFLHARAGDGRGDYISGKCLMRSLYA